MDTALPNGAADPRFTVERYLALVDEGVLAEDDRVELLDGVVVAMAPQNPPHAGITHQVAKVLRRAVGEHADVREDKPLILAPFSMPEPDVAVVELDRRNYVAAHPRTALLLVEVSDSSLPQDRITKARIYAAAGIPEYWIVNLRVASVEIFRSPNPDARCYAVTSRAIPGDRLALVALPEVEVSVADMLPLPEDT
jgi:Uma2 family endonuclease